MYEAPLASDAELARFHDPAYVDALKRAEATQAVSDAERARFRLGAEGNPIYREMFRRPAISAGGVILAARLTREGGVVHCPGGGTHHGRRDRAAGFCFINDPVLGLYAWLDAGLSRVVYLDIDAHHGDGVQDAFGADDRVFTISVHEAGRWPFTGAGDRTGRRHGTEFSGPGRLQRQRDGLAAAPSDPAADPPLPAAGDHAPVRRRCIGGGPARQARPVEQRLLAGGAGDA